MAFMSFHIYISTSLHLYISIYLHIYIYNDKIQVHARHCVLRGLSPAQNRSIPPLMPAQVHEIARTFPDLKVGLCVYIYIYIHTYMYMCVIVDIYIVMNHVCLCRGIYLCNIHNRLTKNPSIYLSKVHINGGIKDFSAVDRHLGISTSTSTSTSTNTNTGTC